MAESLSKLFEEPIDEVYSDFGWLDSDTVETGGEIFNIQDFALCFKKTFERHGYIGEATNVGTTILTIAMIIVFMNFVSYLTLTLMPMMEDPDELYVMMYTSGDFWLDPNILSIGIAFWAN